MAMVGFEPQLLRLQEISGVFSTTQTQAYYIHTQTQA